MLTTSPHRLETAQCQWKPTNAANGTKIAKAVAITESAPIAGKRTVGIALSAVRYAKSNKKRGK